MLALQDEMPSTTRVVKFCCLCFSWGQPHRRHLAANLCLPPFRTSREFSGVITAISQPQLSPSQGLGQACGPGPPTSDEVGLREKSLGDHILPTSSTFRSNRSRCLLILKYLLYATLTNFQWCGSNHGGVFALPIRVAGQIPSKLAEGQDGLCHLQEASCEMR